MSRKALSVLLAVLLWLSFRKRWTEDVQSTIRYDGEANIAESSSYDDTW